MRPSSSAAVRLAIGLFGLFLTGAAGAQVTVERPWVRGVVPGQTTTGAFMDLTSSEELTLVGATSPVAKSAELHSMELTNGVMKMRPVKRLALAAGQTVRLAPGGYHLMLVDLTAPLKNADLVPITLIFEDAHNKKKTIQINAQVRGLVFGGPVPIGPPAPGGR